ncbi:hypothetical protein AAFF_G00424910 [Aldrovandia affinis]|uniref:Uncharacterized protein n=1 Tax=Aldrovandia affinis TaxID=143900 RepID=A0AAD7WZJ0_9TELE|nr:hypothetical protein AAFF_G00424910 [Aldrovandia affinis]
MKSCTTLGLSKDKASACAGRPPRGLAVSAGGPVVGTDGRGDYIRPSDVPGIVPGAMLSKAEPMQWGSEASARNLPSGLFLAQGAEAVTKATGRGNMAGAV